MAATSKFSEDVLLKQFENESRAAQEARDLAIKEGNLLKATIEHDHWKCAKDNYTARWWDLWRMTND